MGDRIQIGLFLFCIAPPKVAKLCKATLTAEDRFAGLIMKGKPTVQTKGRGGRRRFFCETVNSTMMALLTLATLGDITQIGLFSFEFDHSRYPSLVNPLWVFRADLLA